MSMRHIFYISLYNKSFELYFIIFGLKLRINIAHELVWFPELGLIMDLKFKVLFYIYKDNISY